MAETTIERAGTGLVSDRARFLTQTPGFRQVAMLVGVAASVAVGITIVLWSQKPDFALLYANLADRDAGAVVNALRATAIPYELDKASGAILVPADQVHEARLKLAADGLPQGSGLGFELIQSEQGFGTSQFMETARYQHMLETELVRTISSLRPVRSARVHLALPRQSVFVRDRREASASVMVELYPGRRMEPAQVAAVVHMVASSIPDLEAGKITVVDQHGRMLTEADQPHDLALTARQFEHKNRVEESYARRIETLLAPIVGQGRVHAQVTADLDFTVSQQTQESFDPERPALRSEQSSSETDVGDAAATGVPGALSNQPPAAGADADRTTSGRAASSATRNFELDRTIAQVRRPSGIVTRLSVAVIVDDRQTVAEDGTVSSAPLSETELARLTTLVGDAIGADEVRGDTVSVINTAFTTAPELDAPATKWWEMPLLRSILRQVVGVVVVLALVFGLLRPTVRQLLTIPAPALTSLPPGMTIDETVDGAGTALIQGGNPALSWEDKLAAARSVVETDPRRAARVMKTWVAEDE